MAYISIVLEKFGSEANYRMESHSLRILLFQFPSTERLDGKKRNILNSSNEKLTS